jgi:cobalt-zinc-cadmium efflux system membrane fusion protein
MTLRGARRLCLNTFIPAARIPKYAVGWLESHYGGAVTPRTTHEAKVATGLRFPPEHREDNSSVQESASPPPPRTVRALPRRTQLWIIGALVLVVSGVAGLGSKGAHLFGRPSEPSAEAAAPGAFRLTPAQLASLKVTPVEMFTFRTEQVTDGKIALNSDRTTPVFSPYSGRVTKVIANLGDSVRQGDRLLAVEAVEFAQGQNDLISAVSAVNTARSQLSLAQTNEQRKHALYDAKAGALQDWQQAQAELVTAQNNLRSAETALALVRNRLHILGKSDAEIGALENARKVDPVSFVLAPISGRVTDRQVGPGQYIQAAATAPVYSIGDLSTVWLIANVREADAPLMRRGVPVEVHVLAFPGKVFKAKLTYVAPSVDANTHRLPVRAEVENPDGALKPEMFASFSIITGKDSAAPAVPQDAIVYEGDTARVWVVQEDASVASREIRAGRTSNGMVEVTAGVNPGEKVVTSGTLFIDRAAKRD